MLGDVAKDLTSQGIAIAKRASCKTVYFCPPERSKGSQAPENTIFFALLRMTRWVLGEFCKRLKSFFQYGNPYNPPCPPLIKGGTTRNSC
jgi:hypothetical protein